MVKLLIDEYSSGDLSDWNAKGFFPNVKILLPDKKMFVHYFSDIESLKIDLENHFDFGYGAGNHLAFPGLIILKEITVENMQNAVDILFENGYYDQLVPLENNR